MAIGPTRRRFVVANWKMHGNYASNDRLLGALLEGVAQAGTGAGLVICGPFPYLGQLRQRLAGSRIGWGAQDVSVHAEGAFTGEVSAAMLADFDCQWVLCGHSERRAMHAENSAQVAAKAIAALNSNLTPIICLGETQADRDAGETECVIGDQLDPVLQLGTDALRRCVIAYEPVWAIGTGQTASPSQAQAMHAFIRKSLARCQAEQIPILYGGSVKPDNAAELFAQPDIDGALVGGASLLAEQFLNIAAALAHPAGD